MIGISHIRNLFENILCETYMIQIQFLGNSSVSVLLPDMQIGTVSDFPLLWYLFRALKKRLYEFVKSLTNFCISSSCCD
jgi:hypothetical protein